MLTTKSAQIASFEIWSRAQSIICALPFCSGRPLGPNILHALVPLLGVGNEAVLSAGKGAPLGVRSRCLLDCIRNAKQYLGLALIGAARQKQCQTDNGKVFSASQKASKTRFPGLRNYNTFAKSRQRTPH